MDDFKIIATTFKGLESVLEDEIRRLGGRNIRRLVRAVSFYGDKAMLYEANGILSTALRVLKPVAHLRNLKSVAAVYNKVYDIPWENYFDPDKTVFFHVSGQLDTIPHSHFVSQKVKDALVDRFRDRFGRRPAVDKQAAQVVIDLHLFRDQMSVSLDSSGEPLFKRGYRRRTGRAPLNEALAAGIIRLTGWRADRHLIDPMCGSGTIPIEAALQAARIPPGFLGRSFAFMHWKDYDPALFETLKRRHMSRVRPPVEIIRIQGYDKDARMVETARENALAAGVEEYVSFEVRDFFQTQKIPGPTTLLFNPPYDQRLSLAGREAFYERVGKHLQEAYHWSTVWILSPELWNKYLGRRAFKVFKLMNGKIPVYLAGYRIE